VTALQSDWQDYVGNPSQIVRLERFVRAEGPGRGDRVLRVVSGGGLSFDVLPDRGFDIGHAEWNGTPLAWISPAPWRSGEAQQGGMDWLRGFGGGLLTTCGLDSFGPPSDDGGRSHGLHGPISAQRGEITEAEVTQSDVVISGCVRQSGLFAENLRLNRRITVPHGGSEIEVVDTITNDGCDPEGHMILWHCNFGWPLLERASHIDGPGGTPEPRDGDAEAGLATWADVDGPHDVYPEQVFIHAAPSQASARIVNPSRGIALRLEWDGNAMPAMFQWKMLRRKHYVMGLEPANTPAIHGRARARADGALPELQPGESRTYRLRITIEAVA